jgi:hypothetical protein
MGLSSKVGSGPLIHDTFIGEVMVNTWNSNLGTSFRTNSYMQVLEVKNVEEFGSCYDSELLFGTL